MTFEDLLALATVVRDESTDEANTAVRIGSLLLNIINKMSEIETTPGESPQLRTSGEFVQTKLPSGPSWINLYNKNVAFQKTDTHIQWKFGDGAWVNLVALSEITGSNGLSAYQIALLNGFVGTPEEWLESLQGSPDTPGQVVAKLNSIAEEENKLQTTAIGGIESFVTEKVTEVAPEIAPNAQQFSVSPAPGNELFLKNVFVATSGNQVSYDANRRYGTALAPLLGNMTQSLVGASIGTRQLIYHRQTVAPTFPVSWRITSGTYGILPTDLNIILVDYHADNLQTVNIITVTYGEPPILEGIILHLRFEEAPTPTTLADSSGNNIVVNVQNQGQGIVSLAAPVDLGIGLGNLADNNGSSARVVSDADTQLLSTAFTIAFWAMIPTGVTGLTGNWFDSSDNYTENGIRIKNISDGRMEIYLNNIGAENTINRLRVTGNNMAADNVWVHWCFVFDGTNMTIFRNNVQVATTTALSGRNIANQNDWYLNATVAGGGNRKFFDDLFVLARAIDGTERTILYNRGL